MSMNKNIPIADPSFGESTSGLAGGVSWHGLVDLLRHQNFVKEDEEVTGFRVTDHNISYYIRKKVK